MVSEFVGPKLWLCVYMPALSSPRDTSCGCIPTHAGCFCSWCCTWLLLISYRCCAGMVVVCMQGVSIGCKPLVAVMRYMQDSNTSIAQLEKLLQPLLDAEQHLSQQLPTPIPHMTPAERSAHLRRQLQDMQGAGHSSNSTPSSSSSSSAACAAAPAQQLQYAQPRVAHLMHNLRLVHESLSVMDREDGFKQVAHGPLQLWYCHDAAAKCQIIRARVVLEEPLSVSSSTGWWCVCITRRGALLYC